MSAALFPTVLNGPGLEIHMHLASSTDASTEARILTEVFTLARRHAGKLMSGAAADDLAQDVVLECLTRMRGGKWRVPRSLAALVRSMAKRRRADLRLQHKRRASRQGEYAGELAESTHAWMSPDLALRERELERFHEQALAKLPRTCRMAYIMVREEDTPYSVVADRLGVSRAAVNACVVRAQRRLRAELLDKRIVTPPPARARSQAHQATAADRSLEGGAFEQTPRMNGRPTAFDGQQTKGNGRMTSRAGQMTELDVQGTECKGQSTALAGQLAE
jgi:RNA polymerase sigma factor (sigma-70 family)